eukprot:7330915-Prymnesium_polylepis.1
MFWQTGDQAGVLARERRRFPVASFEVVCCVLCQLGWPPTRRTGLDSRPSIVYVIGIGIAWFRALGPFDGGTVRVLGGGGGCLAAYKS